MIKCLATKEFVVTIEWIVDADDVISEGIETALEQLRETGSAEVKEIEMRSK